MANYQVLFLDLRSIEKLTEEDAYEANWLKILLRDLVEAIYDFILKNQGSSGFNRDNAIEEDLNASQQVHTVPFYVIIYLKENLYVREYCFQFTTVVIFIGHFKF